MKTYPASGLTYGDNTPTAASTVYIEGKHRLQRRSCSVMLSLCLEVEEALRSAKEEEGRNERSPALEAVERLIYRPCFTTVRKHM